MIKIITGISKTGILMIKTQLERPLLYPFFGHFRRVTVYTP